jgi:AraC-like DNA-binding protein
MSVDQQILFFFSTLGAFNGFLLSAYLLIFRKTKTPASYFLGWLLLALSIRITKAIFVYFYPGLGRIYLQIGLSGCFFIGPSLYYFIRASLSGIQTTPNRWKWVYTFWLAVILSIGIIRPYHNYPWDWNHYIVHFIYAQWTLYFAFATWTMFPMFAKLLTPQQSLKTVEKQVMSVFIGNAIVLAAYLIVFFGSSGSIYISGAIFFTLLVYLNIPILMNNKKGNSLFLNAQETDKYANKKISISQAESLTAKLDQVIKAEELYKNPDLKLNELARKINISGHQLSQLLNDNLGKSFAAYINEYRIDKACELIAENSSLKLEEIGYEVGFNSKSTFYTAFKKHKNTTPTLHRDQVNEVRIYNSELPNL